MAAFSPAASTNTMSGFKTEVLTQDEGDEVRFVFSTYRNLLTTWERSESPEIREHARVRSLSLLTIGGRGHQLDRIEDPHAQVQSHSLGGTAMDTVETPLPMPEKSKGEKMWARVLRASLALPGAKVDRRAFLRSQLSPYCNEPQVGEAIGGRPALAGVQSEVIDRLADSCIRSHVLKASGTSFAAGLPGGWAMGATIPADLVQLNWHSTGPEAGVPVRLARPA